MHPSPAAVMRHRGPALLVDAIESRDATSLTCTSRARAAWSWPEMLEGAAQAAGLLAGMQPGGPPAGIVAQFRDVDVLAPSHPGPLRFLAVLDRRVLHFWRCRIEVRDAAGELLLRGQVTTAHSGEPG
jgi:predicted hotdog family 3-hydroxylacyl-ACP dehydratase